MELIKKILFVSIALSGSSAWAACPPPADVLVMPPAVPPVVAPMKENSVNTYKTSHYWKECYSTVSVHSFGGGALKMLEELKITYQQKYHASILAQVLEANENKMAALKGGYESLVQMLNENYSAMLEAKTKMSMEMLEMELDYTKSLREQKMNEEHHGLFNDDNGAGGVVRTDTQSYQFYKSVCKRNKMFNKTASSSYKAKRNASVNKEVTKKTVELTSITGSANELVQAKLDKHKVLYCSAEEVKYGFCENPELKLCEDDNVDSGVCKTTDNEVYEVVNKDTDAINFLEPDGFDGRYSYDGTELVAPRNEIKDELFKVQYTYTDDQAEAARDFANNIVYQEGVAAPTNADKASKVKESYVAEYNRYLGTLNMANYSFQNSIESRLPITEGEIKMSEKDVMRYLIHDLNNSETNSATMAAKDKAPEVMLYQLLTINNKLRLGNIDQKERIEGLLATIVAQQQNKPSELEEMKRLK